MMQMVKREDSSCIARHALQNACNEAMVGAVWVGGKMTRNPAVGKEWREKSELSKP